jgi:hypothetical protein
MPAQKKVELHRDGHKFSDRSKKQSIGDSNRKRGSFKGKKAYRGQGR